MVPGKGVQLALAIKIESAIADVGPPGLVLRGDQQNYGGGPHLGSSDALLGGLGDSDMGGIQTSPQPVVRGMLGVCSREDILNGLNSNCSGDLTGFVAPHAITYYKDLP